PSTFFSITLPSPSELYPLSLHDALPISAHCCRSDQNQSSAGCLPGQCEEYNQCKRAAVLRPGYRTRTSRPCSNPTAHSVCTNIQDRKSTRLNSSHVSISYAVFCLKKKKI